MALRLLQPRNIILSSVKNLFVPSYRLASNQKLADSVACSEDGSVIVCWHPEQPISYEHTKPLPESQEELDVSRVLKNADMKLLRKAKPDEFVREELMAMTYTTKHRWFPRKRDRKAKIPPKDREYL